MSYDCWWSERGDLLICETAEYRLVVAKIDGSARYTVSRRAAEGEATPTLIASGMAATVRDAMKSAIRRVTTLTGAANVRTNPL